MSTDRGAKPARTVTFIRPHAFPNSLPSPALGPRPLGARGFLRRARPGVRTEGPSAAKPGSRSASTCRSRGEVILRGDRRFVLLRDARVTIRMEKRPGALVPLVLRATIPGDARHGDRYAIRVAQHDQRGERVGGATVMWSVIGG